MKKIFAQPEMMVVNVKNNDIITGSDPFTLSSTPWTTGNVLLAPGQRDIDSWYEGY